MSQWNGFGALDLSEVEAEKGRVSLIPGNYVCKIVSAEIKDTNDKKGKGLVVSFKNRDGGGTCDTFLNIVNRNEEAERIGRGQLKALLIAANHPNPDRPGDVKSMEGLLIGVRIEQGDDWTDKNGNVRPGGGKVRRSGAFFDPASGEVIGPHPVSARKAAPAASGPGASRPSSGFNPMDDDIPF